MKGFIDYWFAVLRLTKAQAFAWFYKFILYSGSQGDDDV